MVAILSRLSIEAPHARLAPVTRLHRFPLAPAAARLQPVQFLALPRAMLRNPT